MKFRKEDAFPFYPLLRSGHTINNSVKKPIHEIALFFWGTVYAFFSIDLPTYLPKELLLKSWTSLKWQTRIPYELD